MQAQDGAKNYAVVTESAQLDEAIPNVIGSVYGNARVSAVLRTMLSLVSVTYMLNSVNDWSLRLMTSRLALVSMRRPTSSTNY